VVVDCLTIRNSIDQNWTWGELQVMDIHYVDKNTPKLAFTFDQWKEEYDHIRDMSFSIDITKSNEDIRNHIF
jgi:hypothetical protein